MKIAFLLYPVEKVRVDEDTSFWVMHELARRGHDVRYFESRDLFLENGRAAAFMTRAKTHPAKGFLRAKAGPQAERLDGYDAIFIRKEPPFDTEYLYALQILSGLPPKVWVLNDPVAIALSNEKLFALEFGIYSAESLVTENADLARRFVRRLGSPVIVKPLDNKGGTGILSTSPKDPNLPSLLETLTRRGTRKVVLQRDLNALRHGDKRILILDGQALGVFERHPGRGDFRANLSAGGSMRRSTLTHRERALIKTVAPELSRRGLWFVGLDVIGGYLTEINVTSPSGIPEINRFYRARAERRVADFIEKGLAEPGRLRKPCAALRPVDRKRS